MSSWTEMVFTTYVEDFNTIEVPVFYKPSFMHSALEGIPLDGGDVVASHVPEDVSLAPGNYEAVLLNHWVRRKYARDYAGVVWPQGLGAKIVDVSFTSVLQSARNLMAMLAGRPSTLVAEATPGIARVVPEILGHMASHGAMDLYIGSNLLDELDLEGVDPCGVRAHRVDVSHSFDTPEALAGFLRAFEYIDTLVCGVLELTPTVFELALERCDTLVLNRMTGIDRCFHTASMEGRERVTRRIVTRTNRPLPEAVTRALAPGGVLEGLAELDVRGCWALDYGECVGSTAEGTPTLVRWGEVDRLDRRRLRAYLES